MIPPLPTPPAATLSDPDGQTLALFTEAQLLAYRDACIEMCAKEFDRLYLLSGQEVGPAIRSLK